MLWGPPPSDVSSEIASRMHNVAKVAIDRLKAEFPNDLRRALHCFHCPAIQEAFGCKDVEAARNKRLKLVKGIRTVGVALALGGGELELGTEYLRACKEVCRLTDKDQPLAAADNPGVWSAMLDSHVLSSATRLPILILVSISRRWRMP